MLLGLLIGQFIGLFAARMALKIMYDQPRKITQCAPVSLKNYGIISGIVKK